MSPTILPDRLERFLSPDFHLRSGAGKGVNSHVDVCVMQAASWLAGKADFTDWPECVSPVLRRYCIRLNDSDLFRGHRDDLKPFAPRLIGTAGDPATDIRRGFIAADYAVRVFSPMRLRSLDCLEWAAKLEAVAPVNDQNSAKAASKVARELRAAVDTASAAAVAAAAAVCANAYVAVGTAAAGYAVAYAAADDAAAAAAAVCANAYADADADDAAAAAAAGYAVVYAAADAAAVAVAVAYAVAYAKIAPALRAKCLECLDAMIGA